MPERWNPWTVHQKVRFDYERAPKVRTVRLTGSTAVQPGELARVGVGGAEIEAEVVSVEAASDGGVLVVRLRRRPAKAESARTRPRKVR